MCLELGKGHLDGVQIGRVLRQEQHPCATALQGGFGFGAEMDRQVVEDDDITFVERGEELGLDVGVESLTVDGSGNDPRGLSYGHNATRR